jgi:hypothetical protein
MTPKTVIYMTPLPRGVPRGVPRGGSPGPFLAPRGTKPARPGLGFLPHSTHARSLPYGQGGPRGGPGGPFWGHFGAILGPFWGPKRGHFWPFLGPFLTPPGVPGTRPPLGGSPGAKKCPKIESRGRDPYVNTTFCGICERSEPSLAARTSRTRRYCGPGVILTPPKGSRGPPRGSRGSRGSRGPAVRTGPRVSAVGEDSPTAKDRFRSGKA